MKTLQRFSVVLLFVLASLALYSCNKNTVPPDIYGTWKLILQGNDNAAHRIDTFSLGRTNDSVLQQYLTFNTDNLSGNLRLVGYGKDTGKSKWMDSTYNFTWMYFNDGPELWIHLIDNPKKRFTIWTDSTNVHLHVNYYNNLYFCDFYLNVLTNASSQQVFQRLPQ